jgi:hypothetical protein
LNSNEKYVIIKCKQIHYYLFTWGIMIAITVLLIGLATACSGVEFSADSLRSSYVPNYSPILMVKFDLESNLDS